MVLYSGFYAVVLDENAALRLVRSTPYKTELRAFSASDGRIYRDGEAKQRLTVRNLSLSRGPQRNFFIEGSYDSGYKYEVLYIKSRYDSVRLTVKSRKKIEIIQVRQNEDLVDRLKGPQDPS